jgi:hypothetical protein
VNAPRSNTSGAYFLDWRVADRIKTRVARPYRLLARYERRPHAQTCHGLRIPPGPAPYHHPAVSRRSLFRSRALGVDSGCARFAVCPDGPPNYAWCFDCVLEENSLLFDFGGVRIEAPAIDLVFQQPRELLGDPVHARFGAEFPIRFDFLDTMQGGNLSLQVHPLTEYIYDKFGMAYTQDESYYMLDAGEDACVYLGVKQGVDRAAMLRDLHAAQGRWRAVLTPVNMSTAGPHINTIIFLIPGGTIHCSGAKRDGARDQCDALHLHLQIVGTGGRLGLDGPSPARSISNTVRPTSSGIATRSGVRAESGESKSRPSRGGAGWTEERTGLHEREFIETRRHWFSSAVSHDASHGVHVLNLVEGAGRRFVESPAWRPSRPSLSHYAEDVSSSRLP